MIIFYNYGNLDENYIFVFLIKYFFNCTKGNVVSFGKIIWKRIFFFVDIFFYFKSSFIIKFKRVRGLERKIFIIDNKVVGIYVYNLRSWINNKFRNR